MKIELNNIGPFVDASVDIDGITVVAGENGTGKSTIGKTLYAMFDAFYLYNKNIKNRRVTNIEMLISNYLSLSYVTRFRNGSEGGRLKQFSEHIVEDLNEYLKDKSKLEKDLYDYYEIGDKNEEKNKIDEIAQSIYESLNLTDYMILKNIVDEDFDNEFHSEISNKLSKDASVAELIIKDKSIRVKFSGDSVSEIPEHFELTKKIVYIDDPYVLDDLNDYSNIISFVRITNKNHRNDLLIKLKAGNQDSIEKIKIDNKLSYIFEKLDGINVGELFFDKTVFKYNDPSMDVDFDVRNIATGLKSFVILKTLLENGSIEQNGIIIFDEPETHLHPKWQLVLAELIVLIQKEFNMHVLINTHSPYFMRAIEVYSSKHETDKTTKYYLAKHENGISCIEDVTDSTEKIYGLLAEPLDRLSEDLEDE
nr:AAA family ATPase [Ezakiella coagulans]